jgi:transcriptional regulator with XRE-family HTH domain
MIISATQCRAGRALLDWSRDELAEHSRVAKRTIVDFERGAREPREATLTVIRQALEEAGVIFIDQNGGGPGVRLRDPQGRAKKD